MGGVLSCLDGGASYPAEVAAVYVGVDGHQVAAAQQDEFRHDGLIWRNVLGALHALEPGFHDASDWLRQMPDEFCAHKHGHHLALEDGGVAQRRLVAALYEFAPHELSAPALREMMLAGARPHLLPALGVLLHYRLLDFSLKHEHDVHCGAGMFGHRHCTLMHRMALHGAEAENPALQSTLAERFDVLTQAGVDLDTACAHGDTPLMWALRWGSPAATRALVRAGAALTRHDSEGYTALHRAAQAGNADAVSLLIRHGHPPDLPMTDRHHRTALQVAADRGHCRSISALSLAGAGMNAQDADFNSALLLALRKHHVHSLRTLARHGADVNLAHGPQGYTALHWAVRMGAEAEVRALIDLGATLNIRARDGTRPLHFVGLCHSDADYSIAQMKRIADILLAAGAIIDAADNRGGTAIDVAADQGNPPLFDHLLRRGAVPRHSLDMAVYSP